MIDRSTSRRPPRPWSSRASGWVRARRAGILHLDATLGQRVTEGERLGALHDCFGRTPRHVHANRTGIVIGRTEQSLVNSREALVHVADFSGEE